MPKLDAIGKARFGKPNAERAPTVAHSLLLACYDAVFRDATSFCNMILSVAISMHSFPHVEVPSLNMQGDAECMAITGSLLLH